MATFNVTSDLVNLPDDVKAIIKDGKNGKSLRCQRCPSLILKDLQGKYVHKDGKNTISTDHLILHPDHSEFMGGGPDGPPEISIFLPHMKKKSENQKPEDGETLNDFWKVEGMYTFENVGFSNTVNNTKYLVCADCEVGPIGYQDLSDPNSLYVAFDRVNHEN